MSNNIVTATGEYIKTNFTNIDSGKVWTLIGSRNNKNPKKCRAINAVDEFKCIQTGEYLTCVREQVYNLAELGKIK